MCHGTVVSQGRLCRRDTTVPAFSEKAVNALIEKYLLIIRQVFRMKCFHTGHFIIPVQKLIFSLSHLVEGQELYAGKSYLMQKLCNSLRIGQLRIEARDYGNTGQNIEALFVSRRSKRGASLWKTSGLTHPVVSIAV